MPDLVRRLFPYNTNGELYVPIGPELEKVAISFFEEVYSRNLGHLLATPLRIGEKPRFCCM